jgi:ABC-type dipeptide/oligopeptide/nickel transport system ATPase component
MRSYRILVVMDGKIVEEGSHNELIRARGKYYDLWSKQTFIEPEVEQSRSRRPRKHDSNLISGLDSGASTVKFAKALNRIEHDEPKTEGRR